MDSFAGEQDGDDTDRGLLVREATNGDGGGEKMDDDVKKLKERIK